MYFLVEQTGSTKLFALPEMEHIPAVCGELLLPFHNSFLPGAYPDCLQVHGCIYIYECFFAKLDGSLGPLVLQTQSSMGHGAS